MPKTSSSDENFLFVLICEFNANGNVFSFRDQVSYCDSKTVHENVFNFLLLASTNPFEHGAYGVRGVNCTLYTRQKCINSQLIYSFSLYVAKMPGIPNLSIQWSNNFIMLLLHHFWSSVKNNIVCKRIYYDMYIRISICRWKNWAFRVH